MDPFRIRENQQLLLLIRAIYISCILVFWPLMTVIIWSAAIAIALLAYHSILCCEALDTRIDQIKSVL
jgi:hypothetical protein